MGDAGGGGGSSWPAYRRASFLDIVLGGAAVSSWSGAWSEAMIDLHPGENEFITWKVFVFQLRYINPEAVLLWILKHIA